MRNFKYNVWCYVEVYDTRTDEHTNLKDEHTDLNPDFGEYKIFTSDSLEEVAEFITNHQVAIDNHESGVLLELEDAMTHEGLI